MGQCVLRMTGGGGGTGWTRPTQPISDVKAQRRSGCALSFLGFFFLFIVNKTQMKNKKTPRWKCTRKCLMEMKPEQVRLRRQHRKSPLSKIPLSFLFFWPWHEFPPLNF